LEKPENWNILDFYNIENNALYRMIKYGWNEIENCTSTGGGLGRVSITTPPHHKLGND